MAARKGTNGTSTVSSESRYWISFDLGVMGDYSQFYEWLDSHGAKECGFRVATLTSAKTRDDLAAEIQQVLKAKVGARVYWISMEKGGRFIVGGRKAAPWTGYAVSAATIVDEASWQESA